MLQKKATSSLLNSEDSACGKLLSNDHAILFSGVPMLDAGFAVAIARIF